MQMLGGFIAQKPLGDNDVEPIKRIHGTEMTIPTSNYPNL